MLWACHVTKHCSPLLQLAKLPTRPNQLANSKYLNIIYSDQRSYYFRGICMYKPDEFHPQKTGLYIRLHFSASDGALYRAGTQNKWKKQIHFYKLNNSFFISFHCNFMLSNSIFCFSLLWYNKHQSRIRK